MPNLGLVNYSDSETSETEVAPPPTTKAKPSSKSAVERVVDRSNPHKIRVRLPASTEDTTRDGTRIGDEPPSKKPRIGGGGGGGMFSGFNSLLPAPKRTSQTTGSGRAVRNGLKNGGLGSKVQLRTSATPGFSREVETPAAASEEISTGVGEGVDGGIDGEAKEIVEQWGAGSEITKPMPENIAGPGPKKDTKPIMFKPLSVARKPQQKQKSATAPKLVATSTNGGETYSKEQLKAPPKISLFSVDHLESATLTSSLSGEYKPMVYESHGDKMSTSIDPTSEASLSQQDEIIQHAGYHASVSSNIGPQSLDSIATDLGLSESAKRQLFGRQKGSGQEQGLSSVNIINFNTDQEYAANEALRAAGETVTHNPVRAIAPGKHSLKQLVNAANSQKDALEEHFATGRRNKKEAGSRYGW